MAIITYKNVGISALAACVPSRVIDNYKYERELNEKGITLIAGVDEVGRGPLIGPVVAATVILPKDFELKGLTDSKKLSEKKREEFYKIINENVSWRI